jgi:hypothetical protein
MPLTQVQQNTGQANPTAGALSVVFGSAPVQNNLLICAAMSSSFGSMTSTGWSSGPLTDDFDAMYMYYKIAGASESSTVSWTPSANDETALWIAEYSGNVTVSPLDGSTFNKPSVNAATIASGTTATLTQADELAVAVVSSVRAATGATVTGWSNSFVQVAEVNTTGGVDHPGVAVATRDLAATTAITTTATYSTTVNRPIGMIATFKAAAAASSVIVPGFNAIPFMGGEGVF